MERTCENCGTSFLQKGTTNPRRFCTSDCYKQSPRGPRKAKVKWARRMKLIDHPLSKTNGLVSVSRRNLYDTIGDGPHTCHWCQCLIDWKQDLGNGLITADHLDGNPDNNAPENLVAGCHACSSSRRKGNIKTGELTLNTGKGRTRAVQRECENCGKTFLTVPSQIRAGRGRFCSRQCARSPRTCPG